MSSGLDRFERYPLTFGPSPVHPLERLTAELGGASLWAKRDDVCSGLAFGGNKTRKLEYLVADALAQGCDTLVSIGGVQSNHTRQVAACAARAGLGCVLVQESWVDWPDAVYDRVGNILLSRILGAEVRLVHSEFGIGFKESWEQAIADVEAGGGKPYAIPAGASDHPLGGLGYARWAQEVAEQEAELGVFFDTVIVCSVTGSTQAGMVAGFAAQERERRVIGIDGSAKPRETLEQVTRIAQATARLIEVGRELRRDELVLDERYHAGTYGIPDEQTLAAIRLAGRLEGMITDPVYEGKSMAGMIDLVRTGEIAKDATVLYAHLGGHPKSCLPRRRRKPQPPTSWQPQTAAAPPTIRGQHHLPSALGGLPCVVCAPTGSVVIDHAGVPDTVVQPLDRRIILVLLYGIFAKFELIYAQFKLRCLRPSGRIRRRTRELPPPRFRDP